MSNPDFEIPVKEIDNGIEYHKRYGTNKMPRFPVIQQIKWFFNQNSTMEDLKPTIKDFLYKTLSVQNTSNLKSLIMDKNNNKFIFDT